MKSWGRLSLRLSMASSSCSTLKSLLSAISPDMVSHMESTILWYCSRFSGLLEERVYISPADLYLPWRMSCTLIPRRESRSPRKVIWALTPVIIGVAPR